jgi:nucleoside-diphosphate-sugar epimerase
MRYVADAVFPAEAIRFEAPPRVPPPEPKDSAGRTVLVTGASGYIGAGIVAGLLDSPGVKEVRAGVRDEAKYAELREHLGQPDRLKPALGQLPDAPWPLEGVDAVIHAAGVRQAARAEDYFTANAEGTRRLVEALSRAGVRKLIYLSSHSVYGMRMPGPWSEALAPHPETPYGLSKWIAEELCLREDNGVEQVIVLRLARVYGLGHRMRWDELPHKFARLAGQGQALPVHDGGQERLDLIHVSDVARACVMAAAPCESAAAAQRLVLNIGSGRQVSVLQLAELCRSAAGGAGLPLPPIQPVTADSGAPRSWGMDIRRARSRLGWAPAMDAESSMRELITAALRGTEAVPRGVRGTARAADGRGDVLARPLPLRSL